MLRPCTPSDAAQICDIYNHYIRETIITFEESAVLEAEMAERIVAVTSRFPWLVWEADGALVGYAYAGPWKARAAYRYTVESTVYLHPMAAGRGIGERLYTALIADLRERGVHCVLGCIALPNPASVSLHEKLGFAKVAEYPQVGFKFGRWIDVGYWQIIL